MYPAALTGLGILGNCYILGGELKDIKAEMKEGFEKVDKRFEKLEVRQTEGERRALSLVKEMLKNCATKK